jgi:ABC-type phosphate/phosphonate transport system substrate-binding protein
MIARRLVLGCLALLCLLTVRSPLPAADKIDDSGAIQFRIYSSLIAGLNKDDARGATQPLFDLLGRRVGERIKCDIHDGKTPEDLFKFGEKLNNGEYQIGAVWGIEYGWLRKKFPRLEVLAVVYIGEHDNVGFAKVFVREGSPFKKLADLKDKRLAVYKDLPLMDRVFLQEMLREDKLEPKKFFAKTETMTSVRQAAAAVKRKEADCVVMSTSTLIRLQNLQPGVAKSLVELKTGEAYPMPVIIGVPEVMSKFRTSKQLWADCQKHLLELHGTPEGKECINFWRFQSFVADDKDYQQKVEKICRKYPVEVLLNLE